MARYRYIGDCAKGYVEFHHENKSIVMRKGVAVEVPDWLAAKLSQNDHFAVAEDAVPEKGKKSKGD